MRYLIYEEGDEYRFIVCLQNGHSNLICIHFITQSRHKLWPQVKTDLCNWDPKQMWHWSSSCSVVWRLVSNRYPLAAIASLLIFWQVGHTHPFERHSTKQSSQNSCLHSSIICLSIDFWHLPQAPLKNTGLAICLAIPSAYALGWLSISQCTLKECEMLRTDV